MVKLRLLISAALILAKSFGSLLVLLPTEISHQILEGDFNATTPSFQPTLTLTPSTRFPTTATPSTDFPTISSTETPTAPTFISSARPSRTRTKRPTARPSFASTNATTNAKSAPTSTKNDDPDKRTINIVIAVVVSVASFFALLAAFCQYRRYKKSLELPYPVHQAEVGSRTSFVGDSGNYYADEGREVNGHETRNWIHIAPTIASKKTTGKGIDTKGYSDITMVDIYGTGSISSGGNEKDRIKRNQKESVRDMTTVNFFDDEEL